MVDGAGDGLRFAVEHVARHADDAEQVRETLLCALLGPVERRALRIAVDHCDAASLRCELACEMQRKCRLADAALAVEQRDDHSVTASIKRCGELPSFRTEVRSDSQRMRAVSKNPKDSLLAKLGERIREAAPALKPGLGS
jgi:hypothetical protein